LKIFRDFLKKISIFEIFKLPEMTQYGYEMNPEEILEIMAENKIPRIKFS
jgi:hypothetical protein